MKGNNPIRSTVPNRVDRQQVNPEVGCKSNVRESDHIRTSESKGSHLILSRDYRDMGELEGSPYQVSIVEHITVPNNRPTRMKVIVTIPSDGSKTLIEPYPTPDVD